jgi:hypothetical protein
MQPLARAGVGLPQHGEAPDHGEFRFSAQINSRACLIGVALRPRSRSNVLPGGAIIRVSMSGHWRFCVAAFLLCAGFSAAPAFSNPLTDLFDFAPKEAAAPAPAQEECLLQPGKSAGPGQHWVYRLEGHRKCWFAADQATISAKRQIRQHAAKRLVRAPEKSEAAPAEKTVLDARAQLLSAAPDTVQSTASAPKVVDTASVPPNDTAVTAAPIATDPRVDQFRPEQARRRPAEVEMLLATEPSANDAVDASVPPAISGAPSVLARPMRTAPSIPEADEGDREWLPIRAGIMLIALGFIFLIGSLLASHFLGPRMAPIPRA